MNGEEEEPEYKEEPEGDDEEVDSSSLMVDIKNNTEKILKNAEREDWAYRQMIEELHKLKLKMSTSDIANINERANSYIFGVKETLYTTFKRKRGNMDDKIRACERLNKSYPNPTYREQIETFEEIKQEDDALVLTCLKLLSIYAKRDELLVNKIIDLSVDGSKKISMEAIEKIKQLEKELEATESFVGYKFNTDEIRVQRRIALKNPKYGANVGYNNIGGIRSAQKKEEEKPENEDEADET
jgi:hypothetical protein